MKRKLKDLLNCYVRPLIRFRNLIPRFFFNRVLSEILLERIEPHRYMDHWSALPFNGQVKRLQLICTIFELYKPDHSVETGTYLGSSTIYIAGLTTGTTYTIEVDQKLLDRASKRFSLNHPRLNIICILGNSSEQLDSLLKNFSKNEKIFLYLDAHWKKYSPTYDEILSLCRWGGNWIAVIDDFPIYHDPNYGHDPLPVEAIKELAREGHYSIYVPQVKAELETGAVRGAGFLFSQKAQPILESQLRYSLLKII